VQALFLLIKEVFKHNVSQPLTKIRDEINSILRGWVNYFKVGNSSNAFAEIKRWLELKMQRHLMRAMKRSGYRWKGGVQGDCLLCITSIATLKWPLGKLNRCVKRIRLDTKLLGERSAGNRHATFEVAGAGNTVLKRTGAPALDPTQKFYRYKCKGSWNSGKGGRNGTGFM
jgi:hypothetical protein